VSKRTQLDGDLTPIAVDPNYRLRDNQFWYGDCTFADLVRNETTITVRVAGLGIRTLAHAACGKDGRPTSSFTLPNGEDRQWWERHRGQRVRVELLRIGHDSGQQRESPERVTAASVGPTRRPEEPRQESAKPVATADVSGTILCIGLDIAWFGGSANDANSRFDCLASLIVAPGNQASNLTLTRICLQDRDPEADLLLEAVAGVLDTHREVDQIVFALDAPIQAASREQLPERGPNPAAGTIERRACENFLSENRQTIDTVAGGANGWHPNIQPGAPLAPRVKFLLAGLIEQGFELWTPGTSSVSKLAIECFPAEAIWAAKRMNGFRGDLTATHVKAYKNQKGIGLTGEQVERLVHDALDGFAALSGDSERWDVLVEATLRWMIADQTWQRDGLYRGGKLLDDVVDTMICLATSLSYAKHGAHVWYDPQHPDDGHIIGPGHQDGGRWVSAR